MSGAPRTAGGFTLIEVLLAALLLACGAVSAAYAVAQARHHGEQARVDATARYLLDDAVAWVHSLPRLDPDAPVFGSEAADTAIDDVDDLDGVDESAPADRAGNVQSADWQRRFVVASVQLADPTQTAAAGSTPLMRVQIGVAFRGTVRGYEELLLARLP